MEPLLTILIPGLLGGLVLALVIAATRRGTSVTFVPRRLAAPSPSLINMSNIRVEGVGGLGMVAAVAVVAVTDSRIRYATILALVLGGGLALVLIAMRRRTGSFPSTGNGPEDRSVLHLEGASRKGPHPPLSYFTSVLRSPYQGNAEWRLLCTSPHDG
jgi:hypothetical protein